MSGPAPRSASQRAPASRSRSRTTSRPPVPGCPSTRTTGPRSCAVRSVPGDRARCRATAQAKYAASAAESGQTTPIRRSSPRSLPTSSGAGGPKKSASNSSMHASVGPQPRHRPRRVGRPCGRGRLNYRNGAHRVADVDDGPRAGGHRGRTGVGAGHTTAPTGGTVGAVFTCIPLGVRYARQRSTRRERTPLMCHEWPHVATGPHIPGQYSSNGSINEKPTRRTFFICSYRRRPAKTASEMAPPSAAPRSSAPALNCSHRATPSRVPEA